MVAEDDWKSSPNLDGGCSVSQGSSFVYHAAQKK